MATVAEALVPILSLILAGFLIRRTAFLPETFWPAAEKLTYFILTPALLIHSLASKKVGALPWRSILLTVQGAVLASAGVLILWWLLRRRRNGPLFTSIFQGGVRFNTFVALAIAEALFGAEGLLVAALGSGFMIPLINVLCVSTFSLAVKSSRVTWRAFLLSLALNPLILGCLIGGALSASGLGLTPLAGGPLLLAGKAAFPLGLMAVGAAYRLSGIFTHWAAVAVSSSIQFLWKPVVAWSLAGFLGLPGSIATVVVILFSVPTAASSFILARQLGGDHETMASIITVQTILSFLTLPVTLFLLL